MELNPESGEEPAAEDADAAASRPWARLTALFDEGFYRANAESRGLPVGDGDAIEHYVQKGDAARVAPHPLFDPDFYAESNPDVVKAGVNLLAHFVTYGRREGRNPHPLVDLELIRSQLAPDFDGDPLDAYLQSRGAQLQPHRLVDVAFLAERQRRVDPRDYRPSLLFYLTSDPDQVSPSAGFDNFSYRRLYPDCAGMNPLSHYVRFGEARGLRPPRDRGPVARVNALIEAAAALDPDVVKPFADPAAVPVLDGYDEARREFRLYRALAKATGRRPHAHVILTPWLKRGGADRAVVSLARALLENDAQTRVLIVCTQEDCVEALDWAAPSRRLSVAKIAREIDDSHDSCAAFCNFLRLHGCGHLYVVNSRFGWDLVANYGATLKPTMRLYGFAFCQDYDDRGRRAGYAWTHLAQAIDPLTAVVSDNGLSFAEFAADHGFDAEDAAKLFRLPLPVDDRLDGFAAEAVAANLAAGGYGRPRVFWAGRFTAQKALDVAAETARALPELEISCYGGSERPANAPASLVIGGPFDDFADLPLHAASLFLHTARWEGLPNVLLEAGAAGLPIVARDVGGVGELVDETTGWLVARDADAAGFVEAIRDVLARPDEAIARAKRMRARIRERHDWGVFTQAVRRLLAFEGAAK